MMDFMEISKQRHTVRKYSQKPVEHEKIEKILEAVSLGLGSAWISYFDESKARALLNIPENWQPVCMLYVGYPADDYKPNENLSAKRKTLSETCFYNIVPKPILEG